MAAVAWAVKGSSPDGGWLAGAGGIWSLLVLQWCFEQGLGGGVGVLADPLQQR